MSLFFASDVDIEFESGYGEGFKLVIEYGVGYENESIVDKFIRDKVDVDIGDSVR